MANSKEGISTIDNRIMHAFHTKDRPLFLSTVKNTKR